MEYALRQILEDQIKGTLPHHHLVMWEIGQINLLSVEEFWYEVTNFSYSISRLKNPCQLLRSHSKNITYNACIFLEN